jgi:hypothetical protein
MQENLDQINEELGQALHEIRLDARDLETILRNLDLLEAKTATQLRKVGAEHLVLNLQRTIAASRLSSAIAKDADAETALRLFNRSNDLGYSTPHQRLLAAAIFGRICLNKGRAGLGILPLEEAMRATNILDGENEAALEQLLSELKSAAR